MGKSGSSFTGLSPDSVKWHTMQALARASSGKGDGTAGRKIRNEVARFPPHEVRCVPMPR